MGLLKPTSGVIGAGYLILRLLCGLTIFLMLSIMGVSISVMAYAAQAENSFFFCIWQVSILVVAGIVLFFELPNTKNTSVWIDENFRFFGFNDGLVGVGVLILFIGIQILAGSETSLGSSRTSNGVVWMCSRVAGIFALVVGFFNLIFSFLFTFKGNPDSSPRAVRRFGAFVLTDNWYDQYLEETGQIDSAMNRTKALSESVSSDATYSSNEREDNPPRLLARPEQVAYSGNNGWSPDPTVPANPYSTAGSLSRDGNVGENRSVVLPDTAYPRQSIPSLEIPTGPAHLSDSHQRPFDTDRLIQGHHIQPSLSSKPAIDSTLFGTSAEQEEYRKRAHERYTSPPAATTDTLPPPARDLTPKPSVMQPQDPTARKLVRSSSPPLASNQTTSPKPNPASPDGPSGPSARGNSGPASSFSDWH